MKKIILLSMLSVCGIAVINSAYAVNSVAILEETTNGNVNNNTPIPSMINKRTIDVQYCGSDNGKICDRSDPSVTSEYGDTGNIDITYLNQHYGYVNIPLQGLTKNYRCGN